MDTCGKTEQVSAYHDGELSPDAQREFEAHLAQLFARIAPHAVGNDYFVVGTVERKHWRRGLSSPLTNAEMIEALHDFKDHLRFKPAPRWVHTGPRAGAAQPR